jgi:hypothetical protein
MKLTERLAERVARRIFPPLQTAAYECGSCRTKVEITDVPEKVTAFLDAQVTAHRH